MNGSTGTTAFSPLAVTIGRPATHRPRPSSRRPITASTTAKTSSSRLPAAFEPASFEPRGLAAGDTEPPYEEPIFSRPPPQSQPQSASPLAMQLTTAAELANGGVPAPPVSPDAFHQDMLVRHPRYGLGRVVALSGAGNGRKATVDFPAPPGRKQFVLADSPLRPMNT